MSMKNSSDTIGNQTCNLLACSAVPQPTAPPLTPKLKNRRGKVIAQHYYIVKVPQAEPGYIRTQ